MNAEKQMTTENQIATSAEIQNDAEDITQPDVVDPTATDGADEKPAEPAKTPAEIEVERLRRALTKRDRTQGKMSVELVQLREQLAQRQPAQQQGETVQETPADIRQVVEREAMTLAERIAEKREFDTKCNSVAESGKKEFKDFPAALDALIEEAGPLVSPNGAPTALGEQILESEAPAALIHYLGKNPEIAAELDGLTPGRMARKLARIESQMTAKPKTSSAPKPLTPTKGAAGGNDLSSAVDDPDEWRKRREAQLRKR